MEHAERLGHLHCEVTNHRKGHLDILHALEFDLFLYGPQPRDVAVGTVDGEAEEFAVKFFELRLHERESHELGGADRSEIGGMGEENHPFALEVVGEVDRPLRAFRLEGRSLFVD